MYGYVISLLLWVPLLLWGYLLPAYGSTIEKHWVRPIPPQGKIPSDLSPLEASLNPKACGVCHPVQFADWQTSLHSKSMGPGILGQLIDFRENRADIVGCMVCHAPLSEQITEFLTGRLPQHLAFPDERGLYRTGVSCGMCHVRGYIRYGPEPKIKKPEKELSHKGFEVSEIFPQSRFCTPCHQFPEGGYSLNGKPLENTYQEWLDSPYPEGGRTCQSCHMPGRRHTFRGIHDPEFTRRGKALKVEITVYPDEFYSRFYENLLSTGLAWDGKAFIERALTNSLSSPYILYEKIIHLR